MLSETQSMPPPTDWMTVNNEPKKMQKEVVMTQVKDTI
jgi:hypothetical protein